eukprot:296199-Chlamydomonas_euryale.AAC.3
MQFGQSTPACCAPDPLLPPPLRHTPFPPPETHARSPPRHQQVTYSEAAVVKKKEAECAPERLPTKLRAKQPKGPPRGGGGHEGCDAESGAARGSGGAECGASEPKARGPVDSGKGVRIMVRAGRRPPRADSRAANQSALCATQRTPSHIHPSTYPVGNKAAHSQHIVDNIRIQAFNYFHASVITFSLPSLPPFSPVITFSLPSLPPVFAGQHMLNNTHVGMFLPSPALLFPPPLHHFPPVSFPSATPNTCGRIPRTVFRATTLYPPSFLHTHHCLPFILAVPDTITSALFCRQIMIIAKSTI